jgi:F-type H+-transporting ATPase subunit b
MAWPIVLIQLLATLLLFLVIRFFLWKPVTKFLAARQEALTKELHDAKAEKERATQLKEEAVKEYDAVKQEAKNIRESMLKDTQLEKERVLSEAREEAKRRLNRVEVEIQQEIRESNEKIKTKIKEVAFLAAEKIVQREINEETHDELINDIIDENL